MAVQSTQVSETSRVRRRLVLAAVLLTLFAALHHADHVIRGYLVVANGLDPDWNHSGWPFREEVSPFTASLAIYLLLVPGIIGTLRGRLWGGYWLATVVVLAAIVTYVHFIPGQEAETPDVIRRTYELSGAHTLAPLLSLLVLGAILGMLLVLGFFAVASRRRLGHW